MKIYSFIPALFLLVLAGCEKNLSSLCQPITLNKPFTAKIGEQWCLEEANWKIEFGPFIEDSRCNVPGIDCVWAGRYVMGALIDNNGESARDTFYAVHNWTDTIYHDAYRIILAKVYPEVRTTMEPLDTSAYSFDILVSQQ